MRIKLLVQHDLVASHSLEGNEAPHPHLWKVELTLTGEPIKGKIIDLPTVGKGVRECLLPFENVYLNECELLNPVARSFPTCETLAADFAYRLDHQVFEPLRQSHPSLQLLSVQVTLCDLDHRVWGSAIVELV